jgi:DNA polymerase-3 subunit alpha
MAQKDDFVHLHLHSDYSQLDGLGKVSEYVELAAKRGSPAIAFTDHGTMRGYLQQHTQCEKHNVKPIYGTEFYVSPDMRRRGLSDDEKAFITKDLPRKDHRKAIEKHEEQIGLRDRWHITVWAYSQQGLQNLYRLSSAAWIEGFYYKARIDLSALIEHGEGLMVSTGCLASPIHEQWREGKKKAALEFADRLHDAFGDRLWLEIQPHNIKIQRLANLLCTKLRDRYPKSRLLATQDAHYVRQGDAPHHDCLLCIGTNAQIDDQERFRFDGDEFFFKSRKQMRESFERAHPGLSDKQVTEALNSTLVFAERCSAVVEVDYKKALLPDPGIPEEYGGDTFKFLKTLCLDGWSWRNIKARAERYAMANSLDVPHAIAIYRDRLLAELKLIRAMKFERYFVMVFDIYREARKRKIFVGPGRGSVGGSLAAYLLGIHSVDPIQHGLLFERFINPDRKDLPDIDMDFEDSRRGEMIEYMRNKYGTENVCQISTIGKLSGKSCFKDVCRVVGVPYTLANSLTASIIHRNPHEEREFNCIEDSFGQENLKAFDKKFPAVKLHGMAIEGTAKTLGIHAAGLIASPVPLRDITPLEVRNSGGEKTVVCALDMNDAAKIGLVKLDFLGLKTLTVIRKCLEAIKERHGKAYDLESEEFDIDDPKVLKAFTDHDYIGVFQYDSPSADQVCKGVTFDRFADVPTMTALNRPGTTDSGMDEQFRKRKADPKLLKKHDFHPIVSNIAKDTLGVLCYQEHLIEIFKQVGGMTPGEADSLRRAVGKKLAKEEIEKYREGFVKGADKVGVSADIAGA